MGHSTVGLAAPIGGPAMSTAFDLTPRQFWATPFYQRVWQDHPAQAPGIISHLRDLQARESAPIASGISPAAKSSAGLFESNFDLFATPHPGLAKFVAFAAESVRLAAAHVNGSRIDPSRLSVEFPDSWFHVTNAGGFHDARFGVKPAVGELDGKP